MQVFNKNPKDLYITLCIIYNVSGNIMRTTIIDQDIPLAEDKRLIKRLHKVRKSDDFPDGLEFAYQFLYFKNDKWIQVARIDNQLHEGRQGTHIHILHRDKVQWTNLTFEKAEEKVIEVGESVIKNTINRGQGDLK